MAAAAGFDPGHAGPVHDAQFDYYGRRLATAGADARVKVFDVLGSGGEGAAAAGGGTPQTLGDLVGHEGPVWQVRPPSLSPPPPRPCSNGGLPPTHPARVSTARRGTRDQGLGATGGGGRGGVGGLDLNLPDRTLLASS